MSRTMTDPLDDWRFLVGKWKGSCTDQFGTKGTIEGECETTVELEGKFIVTTGTNVSKGKLVHRAMSVMFYDQLTGKMRRKTFFSYGFVNNEIEVSRNQDEIIFEVEMEPTPPPYQGTRTRSFVRKVSGNRISTGLMMAPKQSGEFKKYGEMFMDRIE